MLHRWVGNYNIDVTSLLVAFLSGQLWKNAEKTRLHCIRGWFFQLRRRNSCWYHLKCLATLHFYSLVAAICYKQLMATYTNGPILRRELWTGCRCCERCWGIIRCCLSGGCELLNVLLNVLLNMLRRLDVRLIRRFHLLILIRVNDLAVT